MKAYARAVIGFIGGLLGTQETIAEGQSTELRSDGKGALWTHDYQGEPAQDGAAITPSDSTDLATPARAIYVGVGGDITIVTPRGSTVTYVGVPQGVTLPAAAKRVKATGTSASSLVAMI